MKEKLKIEWENYFEDCDSDKLWETFIKKYNEADKGCISKKTIRTGRKNIQLPKKYIYILIMETFS